jgi:pimeloyl-ACP methyl ester carboxylesterase
MPTEAHLIRAGDGVRVLAQLHRHRDPAKPTCLLLHGFGDGGYVWDDVCTALRDVCAIAVIDLRGHGDSDPSPTGAYDLETNVDDVKAVIAQLELSSIIVVGHSFGGEIALRLASCPPVPVAGAVFIDIAPRINQETSRRATAQMQEMLRPYSSAEEYCSLLMSMRPLLSEDTARQLTRGALRRQEQHGLRLKVDQALMQYADEEFTSAAQWQELLATIRCPTLVMRGAGSAMVTANAAKEMLDMLPQAQLVTVPRAGHAVLSDNPAASSAGIATFVRSTLDADAL